MKMFKRDKYQQEAEGMNVNTTNADNGMMTEETEAPIAVTADDNMRTPYKSKPRGAARVLIAARTLFPGVTDNEVALDLFMDLFDEKMRMPAENSNAQERLALLYEEEKRLKKIIPEFSISKAFENEEFKRLVLEEGNDLFTAYEKLNLSFARDKQGMIDEVGSTAYASTPGSKAVNVEKASEEEFKRYIRSILEEE